MAYEDTVLERAKLERYAQKVARELAGTAPTTRVVESVVKEPVTTYESRTVQRTEAVPGSRWFLDRRVMGNKTQHGRGNYTEQHDVESFYLEWDGELTCDWESWEDGISGGRYWKGGKETGDRQPMSDFSILLFDHDFLDPTRRVRVHAKGVGLSLRLKRLLEEKTPSR